MAIHNISENHKVGTRLTEDELDLIAGGVGDIIHDDVGMDGDKSDTDNRKSFGASFDYWVRE